MSITEPSEVPSQPEEVSPESLSERIASADPEACTEWIDAVEGVAVVRELSRLSDDEREQLLEILSPEDAAEVIEHLPEAQAVEAIEHLDSQTAARIFEELPSDEQADLLKEIGTAEADAILEQLQDEDREELRRLAAYDEDVAGGIMVTEYLYYDSRLTVRDVLADLEAHSEEYADYNIQYSYVVDEQERLVGVLPLRKVLLARRATPLTEIMIAKPITLRDDLPLEDLAAVFREHPFIGLPVVTAEGELVGVVERRGVEHALLEEADAAFRQSQGIVGGEELRSMPWVTRSRRRLAWLSINIVLNIAAASVIALYQDTLEAVIALAVFLPIISDMSGCSGNQAVAVSMRELTLGVSRPSDVWRVLSKELTVGVINGLVLGLLIGVVAYAWKRNIYLGGVVGAALMMNTVIAVAIGGAVPLFLKGLKLDPALASGPILTTITDMCGFLLVLGLASALLSRLT